MDRLEMLENAWQALGDASAAELVAYVQRRFGVTIDARYVPIFKASLRDRQQRAAARRVSAERVTLPKVCRGGLSSARAHAVRELVLQLLVRHGLRTWRFRFNRHKCSLGMCFYHRRTIELSIYFVERNCDDEIRDTILHEIAHALVGPDHGHDAVWKRKCLEIGARPLRCGKANMPSGRWRARCGVCGAGFHRHRKPDRQRVWYCPDCGPQRGRLAWRQQSEA